MGIIRSSTGVRRIQIADLDLPDVMPSIPSMLECYLLSLDNKQWPAITIDTKHRVVDGLKRVALCIREKMKSLNGIVVE